MLVVGDEAEDGGGDEVVVGVEGAAAFGGVEFGAQVSGEGLGVLGDLDEAQVGRLVSVGAAGSGAEGVEDVGVVGGGLVGAFVSGAAGADDEADGG